MTDHLKTIREAVQAALKDAKAGHDFDVKPLFGKLLTALDALEAAMREPTILGWINEDELPRSYPYDAMFPHSKVDGVRLFPVFGPSSKGTGVTLTTEEIEALRHTMSAAVLFHRAKSLGEVRENVLTRFDQFFEHVKDHPRPRQPNAETSRCTCEPNEACDLCHPISRSIKDAP